MDLSKLERRLLINQYEIRKRLEDTDEYDELITILEKGFSLYYDDVVRFLYDGLPADDCMFVLYVLDMYRALDHFYQEHPKSELAKAPASHFSGFDGNNETLLMGFARFLIHQQGKFTEQKPRASKTDNFNSHMPCRAVYERMLDVWKRGGESHELSEQQAKAIVEAAKHPE